MTVRPTQLKKNYWKISKLLLQCVTKITKLTTVAEKRSGETDVARVTLPNAKFDSFQLQDEQDGQCTRNVNLKCVRVNVVNN